MHELILSPWWVSLILAVIIFLGSNMLPGPSAQNTGSIVILSMARALAPIFAILCVIASVLSFYRRLKTCTLLKYQHTVDDLIKLSWKDFENITGEYFRQQGYQVEESLGRGPDGGVDLRLRKNSELTLVQCKKWKNKKVGLPLVRELLGAKTAEKADKITLITTSDFTGEAIQFAYKHKIELINGKQLIRKIKQTRKEPPQTIQASQEQTTLPKCPRCNQPMVIRTALRGPKPGKQFWGCSTFPKCRRTMDL